MKVSFEFSPPRTEAAERTLWETIERLTPLRPTFFSVTYGAGGSTRQRTHETVARLKKETGIDAAAHLTCVAATVAGDLCRRLQGEGVQQFHFYTLNRADLTFATCHLLGVRRHVAH